MDVMKSPFISLLQYLERSRGITFNQIEIEVLLGRPYQVNKGTMRSKPDYDDAWLLALAYEAEIVFDIGCNIGQAALLILHPRRVKEIILVDPQPIALSKAAQNLIYNDLAQHARFVCAFVSNNSDQLVDFFTVLGGAASSMYASHAVTASKIGTKKSVSTITVDQMVETYKSMPDLVKIDTEGAERLVLLGATQLAKKQFTRFFVEMHSNPELPMRENAQAILDWCLQINYRAWYLKEKTELVTPELIAQRGRCHLLLLPDTQEFPSTLKHIEQGAPLEKGLVQH